MTSLNTSTNGSMSRPFHIEKTHLYIVLTLYVIISLTSVIGNSLVFISFFKSSKIRNSRTNHLIVSLSFADFISGCITVPIYAYLMTQHFKGYNQSVTYFTYQLTDVFSITASIWHLAVISLDRYFAIVWPVLHHLAKYTVYMFLILIIWLISIVNAGLNLLLYKHGLTYIIYSSSTLFGLPFLIMVFCYMSILRTTIRRSYVSSRGTFERELKVSLTVFILIGLFIITWSPFFIIALLSSSCRCIALTLVLYFKAIHFASSCVNPIVYAARVPDFKVAFKKIFGKRLVCLFQSRPVSLANTSRARASSTLSTTVQMVDGGGKRRATLLENKNTTDLLPVKFNANESSLASSVNSNKCVTLLSDSPSSVNGLHVSFIANSQS